MKRIIIMLLLLIILCWGCKENDSNKRSQLPFNIPSIPSEQLWVGVTPKGINIISDKMTISQYESYWMSENLLWEEIDWQALDELFFRAQEYYCQQLEWNCKSVQPYQLTIRIMPWDSRCIDAESPLQPQEIYTYINGSWQCIDGWLWQGTIYTHLGDDPGRDHVLIIDGNSPSYYYRAWEESSVPHELMHFFQYISGLPYSEDSPSLPSLVTIYKIEFLEEN